MCSVMTCNPFKVREKINASVLRCEPKSSYYNSEILHSQYSVSWPRSRYRPNGRRDFHGEIKLWIAPIGMHSFAPPASPKTFPSGVNNGAPESPGFNGWSKVIKDSVLVVFTNVSLGRATGWLRP